MRRLLLILGLFTLLLSFPTVTVSAASATYDPLQGANGACSAAGATSQSSVCTSGSEITGSNGVLRKVSNTIALIAGIAAVIVIIIGGLQYVVSAGDPQKAASARSAIIGGVVGLVIIASAQGILLFVLSKLQ